MRQFKFWFFMVILLLTPACGLLLDKGREVVAEVGEEPIRLRDLLREIRALPFEARAKTNDPDASVRLERRRHVLNDMINTRLAIKEAEALGIKVSDMEVDAAFEKEDAHGQAMEDLPEGMENAGKNHEHEHKKHSRQEVDQKREKLMIKKLADMEFSDAAVRTYYENHIDEFKVQIPLVRYEIVGIDAAGKTSIIEEVYKKAIQDKTTLGEALASLENVPQNVSTTTTPLTSLIHIVPEMRVRMENLKAGEIAEPFHMNVNGSRQYIVARVIENTNTVPFETIKDQLRADLLKSFSAELHKKYQVVIYEEILNYQVGG